MSLVVRTYELTSGFSTMDTDELFYINGGSGSGSGSGGSSNGNGGKSLGETIAISVLGILVPGMDQTFNSGNNNSNSNSSGGSGSK